MIFHPNYFLPNRRGKEKENAVPHPPCKELPLSSVPLPPRSVVASQLLLSLVIYKTITAGILTDFEINVGGHNIRSYGYYTAAGFVTLVLVHAYFLFQPHDHQLRQEYTHMHQMRKPFPFRDGKTPLFGLSDGEEH